MRYLCKSTKVLRPKRRRSKSGNISEFAIALYVFLLVICFPLLDVCALACSACLLSLSAHDSAAAAAAGRRYTDCLSAMQEHSQNFLSSGFGRFIRIDPVGGYNSCGTDLIIEESNLASGKVKQFPPNQPVPPPIDMAANVYECTTRVTAKVGPLVNLSCVPGMGNVPGLGTPALLTMTASRAAEYPRALEYPSSALAMNTGMPSFDRTASKATSQGVNESGWNYPTIYDAIKAAGETVVASSVIQVYANNNNWTDTKLTINGNEKVWIDTHSVGAWNYGGTSGMVNADGYSDSTSWPVRPGTQFDYQGKVIPTAMLMGTVGTSNKLFEVGKDLWNYVPPQSSGEFYIMQNDGNPGGTMHDDNTGVQTVRVIITR